MSRPVDHRQGIAVSECSGGPFFGCHFQPCPRRSTCFLGPRPSSLEPIALPHPNSQTTKTCRGTGSGLCPGAVLEPAAVPQPRFRGPRIHPRAPADHPALNHPIPDKRAGFWPVSGWPVTSSTARGGSCAPPPRDLEPTAVPPPAFVVPRSTPEPQPIAQPSPPPTPSHRRPRS